MAKRSRTQPKSTARDKTAPRSRRASRRGGKTGTMVFTKRNYLLLLLGLAVIVVGYTLMRWENEVDGFLSLYIAPLLILGGYLEIIYAILWRPKTADDAAGKPTQASEATPAATVAS